MKKTKPKLPEDSCIKNVCHRLKSGLLLQHLFIIFFFLVITSALHAQLPSGILTNTVQTGYSEPMGTIFSSSGNLMFVWERIGKVYVSFRNDSSYVKQSPEVLNISDEVGYWGDHGLLSFCIDPDFEKNGFVYLYYVVDRHHLLYEGTSQYNQATNDYFNATIGRVTRYTLSLQGSMLIADSGSRKVLIGETKKTGIPVLFKSHMGGTLVFGKDKTLLLSTGDGGSYLGIDTGSQASTYFQQAINDSIIRNEENVGAFRSQLINSMSGKVLRFDPNTGDGISSNPFFETLQPRSPASRVWSLGQRNPFRMSIDTGIGSTNPVDANPGVLYIGDVGFKTWEELNIVYTGGLNCGWPIFEGQLLNTDYGTKGIINIDEGQQFITQCSQPSSFQPDNIVSNRRYTHYRPAVAWRHGSTPNAEVPWFNGNIPTSLKVGEPGSPVSGSMFRGNCAIGGVFYPNDYFGTLYKNTYFFADFVRNWINMAKLDTIPGLFSNITEFAPINFGKGIVDLEINPLDKSIYYVNINEGNVLRLYKSANNIPPVVSFISPAPFSTFPAGSAIQVDIAAMDTDGVISKVELFYNGIKLGEDLSAPYTFTGTNVESGIYKVIAKATDDSNYFAFSDTLTITVTACTGTGTIHGEGYTNIPGTQVANMTSHPAYPDQPSITSELNVFEYANVGDNYGGRLRGYICAPLTGNYTFYIAGDDQAGLFLSTDEDSSNKVLIAYNINPVGFRSWNSTATQKSTPIQLIKGKRYFVETQHKQGSGTNHLSVGWTMPNGINERPIPGNRLSPFVITPALEQGLSNKSPNMIMYPGISGNTETNQLTVTIQNNPTTFEFTLITKSPVSDKVQIRISDIQGRIVESLQNIPANSTVKIGQKYKPGVYFVLFTQGLTRKMIRLVKQ